MRIAIATDDGITLRFGHFGDAKFFHIYEKQGDNFKLVEVRNNPFLDEDDAHVHNDQRKAQKILDFLSDCEVFVAHSMGIKSRNYLEKKGIKAITLMKKGLTIKTALERTLEQLSDR